MKYLKAKIVWVDAQSHDEWIDIVEMQEDECPTIETMGFVIKNTNDLIIVAQNYDPKNEAVSMVMSIPRKMVRSIESIP